MHKMNVANPQQPCPGILTVTMAFFNMVSVAIPSNMATKMLDRVEQLYANAQRYANYQCMQ